MVSFSLEGILTKILVLDVYKALSIHKIRQKYRHYTRHYTYARIAISGDRRDAFQAGKSPASRVMVSERSHT